MINIIGIIMLIMPFVVLFMLAYRDLGLREVLKLFGIIILILGWVSGGAYLATV